MLEDAEAYRTQVLKSSQGETERFNQLLAEYQRAPEITRERLYIETIEEVMANNAKVILDVKNGNNLTYLPLDRMISSGNTGSSGGSMTYPSTALPNDSGSSSRNILEEFRRNTARSRARETR